MNRQKELTLLLVKAYNEANFEPIFEHLAEDVKRTSSWSRENIVGKESVIAYFHEREHEMVSTNQHYFAHYAETAYENGSPRTFPLAGGMAGDYPIKPGATGMLWYMEHEPLVTIRVEQNGALEVVVSIELNREQQIKSIHIGDPNIYFLTEYQDPMEMDPKSLIAETAEKVKALFQEEGYIASTHPRDDGWATEVDIQTAHRSYSILVYVDHYPFTGKIPSHIHNYVSMSCYYHHFDVEYALIQAIGKGNNPSRIECGDNFDIEIKQQAPFTTLRFQTEEPIHD